MYITFKLINIIIFSILSILSFSQTAYELKKKGFDKAQQGDIIGAITELSKAIKIDTNDAETFYNRGTLYVSLKKYQESILDFEKSNQINPSNKAYYNKASVEYILKDYISAINDFYKAIEINPFYELNYQIYNGIGDSKGMILDFKGAIQAYTNAIELNPKSKETYFNRAIIKTKIDDFSGAIDDYTKSLLIDNKFKEAYYGRGLIKIVLNKKYDGCIDLKKSSALGFYLAKENISKYCN